MSGPGSPAEREFASRTWYPAWPCVIAGMLLTTLLLIVCATGAQWRLADLQEQVAGSDAPPGLGWLGQLFAIGLTTTLAPFLVTGVVVGRFGDPVVPKDFALTGLFSALILAGIASGRPESFERFGASMGTVGLTIVLVGVTATYLGGKLGARMRRARHLPPSPSSSGGQAEG